MKDHKILWKAIKYFSRYPRDFNKMKYIVHTFSLMQLEMSIINIDTNNRIQKRYKEKLKKYGKPLFDIFKRNTLLTFNSTKTALCQLNFLRWFLKDKVYLILELTINHDIHLI